MPDDSFIAARQRIQAAYDPELLRSAGRRLSDVLADHLTQVGSSNGAVLNWADPRENVRAAADWLKEFQPGGASESVAPLADSARLVEHFERLVAAALAHGQNLHHPRYIGHQVPASVPLAGLFDAVGSVTNQVMAIYEMGPWATAVEQAMVKKLGRQIGFEHDHFAGLVTHGGSLANLTALLTARNITLGDVWEHGLSNDGPQPVLVSHADAHYCIARSAGILGLGTSQVVRAELDERRRMDPERLDDTLRDLRRRGRPIIAVVSCACATPIGAFDPLHDIADVCQKHDVWMHVDAAHGGAACFSSRHRHLVDGLARADSLICDAHKMLFVPALCAFVFYKNQAHRFEAFRQDAPYLFDPSDPGLADFDSGMKTIECTKRAAVFGLWGAWALFGPQLFADMVDVTFAMGRQLYEKLEAAADFEALHEPQCNIVAFRHIPEQLRNASPERIGQFQLDLRRDLIRSGEFYIVPTKFNDVPALRGTVMNPQTTPAHLDQLLDALRIQGKKLSKSEST
jgi:L-2,4-diaminobutyrate decarboxylase